MFVALRRKLQYPSNSLAGVCSLSVFAVTLIVLLAYNNAFTRNVERLKRQINSISDDKINGLLAQKKNETSDVRQPGSCSIEEFLQSDVPVSDEPPTATYAQLLERVYGSLGYETRQPSNIECRNLQMHKLALLPLKEKQPKSCDAIFSDVVESTKNYTPPNEAPKTVSAELRKAYTLNGIVGWVDFYHNDIKPAKGQEVFPSEYFDKILADLGRNKTLPRCLTTSNVIPCYPYKEAVNVLHAMLRLAVRDKRIGVIGTESPWVEGISLHLGASEIVTFEYRQLKLQHSAIRVIHPIKAAKNWRDITAFDLIVSFSSAEHSGLGRYSDPLDPYADLAELRKMHCLLRTGGTLILGLPIARDRLKFNAHREYGQIRLPLMFSPGFELTHFYANAVDKDDIGELTKAMTREREVNPVMVLRKVGY